VLAALCASGCSNTAVVVSAGSVPVQPLPPPSATASVSGASVLGTILTLGLINHAMSGGTPFYAAPPMDPQRRVVEHDCSKPIEDTAANLRCR
jgi:hypothetical protein